MKIFPLKGGHGHVTAWRCTLGSAEVRRAGFLNEDGSAKELEKVVDEEKGTITIRVKREEETEDGVRSNCTPQA